MALAWLLALALLGVAVLRVTGTEHGTVLVLLVGGVPLSLLPAYPLLAAAVGLRHRLLGLVAVGLVATHLLLATPGSGSEPVPPDARSAGTLRVVTANLYVRNPVPEQAGTVLRALSPDVLVVPELGADGLAGLRASGLLDELPHAVVDLEGRDETVGLFSRLPLTDVVSMRSGGRSLPRATVEVDGRPVRILTAHPLPPIGPLTGAWRSALADLGAEVRDEALPVVVAGDLNATRHHAPFRRLLDTGLRDAGAARTWPASFPLLPLDHVLVRGGGPDRLVVTDVAEQRLPGSDHLAVLADLAVVR